MLKINLIKKGTDEMIHFEQPNVSFGKLSKVLEFDAKQQKADLKRQLLNKKFENGTLSADEEAEFLALPDVQVTQLHDMAALVAGLFDSPKVTAKAIEEGLDMSNGITVLSDILSDAMGGAAAEADHPAKK